MIYNPVYPQRLYSVSYHHLWVWDNSRSQREQCVLSYLLVHYQAVTTNVIYNVRGAPEQGDMKMQQIYSISEIIRPHNNKIIQKGKARTCGYRIKMASEYWAQKISCTRIHPWILLVIQSVNVSLPTEEWYMIRGLSANQQQTSSNEIRFVSTWLLPILSTMNEIFT